MNMLAPFIQQIAPQKDGDTIDRLSYYYSVLLTSIFALFVSAFYFLSKPIMCWFPAYFRRWWIEYALDFCYVQNTYFLPLTDESANNHFELGQNQIPIPRNITEREDKILGYYQWVPFILALSAIFFYIPVMFWRAGYNNASLRVGTILTESSQKKNIDPETRKKNVDKIAKFLNHQMMFSQKMPKRGDGRRLVKKYIIAKFLFAFNVIGQFFLLQQLLGLKHLWWGAEVLWDLMRNKEWPETGNFPRVTMCDFEVRELGNKHRHSIQCTLIINMFNEKIFVFLWWWMFIVGILSFCSFIYWVVTLCSPQTGTLFITNYLRTIDPGLKKSPRKKRLVRQFIDECLKADGVFLLRLLAGNAGDVTARDLLASMWEDYTKRHAPSNGPVVLEPSAPPSSEYPTLRMREQPPPYQTLHESDL